MARTQILVHKAGEGGGGAQQGFRHCFADGRNQSLVSSVGQANRLRERDECDIFPITVCVVP